MADFTSGELLTLRRLYLRDHADTSGSGEFLSYYNLSKRANFVSDSDIQSIKARVERDYDQELDSLYDTHYQMRVSEGDTEAAATTSAEAQLLDATMRLVRAEVRDMQINDSGYLETITDSTVRAQTVKSYSNQITADRNFIRQRSGAPFSAVQLERG